MENNIKSSGIKNYSEILQNNKQSDLFTIRDGNQLFNTLSKKIKEKERATKVAAQQWNFKDNNIIIQLMGQNKESEILVIKAFIPGKGLLQKILIKAGKENSRILIKEDFREQSDKDSYPFPPAILGFLLLFK